ncbi:hypothetical protein [Providencia rettgeri]|uniref:hypothetical protein n=1 Tax=Providencia rettgeri TaxID=587 RepID=UPI0034E0DCC0
MKKYLILLFILCGTSVNAEKSVPQLVLDSKEKKVTWKLSSFGEQAMMYRSPYNERSEESILEYIKAYIKENRVIITPEEVIIRSFPSDLNPCQYTYNYTQLPSEDYWGSTKQSEASNRTLSKYGVDTTGLVGVIEAIDDNSGCRIDTKKFLLVNDKIIFSYDGRWVFFSTTKNEPDPVAKKDKYCTIPEQPPVFEGDGYRTECFYDGFSLLKAYTQYRLDYDTDYLEKSIELNKNHKKEYPKDGASVNYKWESPKKLIIDQQFQGGSTAIVIEKEQKGTKITSYSYPD